MHAGDSPSADHRPAEAGRYRGEQDGSYFPHAESFVQTKGVGVGKPEVGESAHASHHTGSGTHAIVPWSAASTDESRGEAGRAAACEVDGQGV